MPNEAGKTGRRKKKRKEGEREKEKKELEKTRAGHFRKRRGESQSFLFRDADQESKTRMRKNALRTGPRQAVEYDRILVLVNNELVVLSCIVLKATAGNRRHLAIGMMNSAGLELARGGIRSGVFVTTTCQFYT
ncbi:hypothetical protein TNCV_135391 [Trichonephila clavipes]|nr:hypothetical protein TNCV_135391 [Trichonephila clavipes]